MYHSPGEKCSRSARTSTLGWGEIRTWENRCREQDCMDLQELITRGRFVFSDAPERLGVFKLVDGKKTASDIAKILNRHTNNIHRDLKLLRDSELIQVRRDKDDQPMRVKGFVMYEKTPLAGTLPTSYFQGPAKLAGGNTHAKRTAQKPKGKRPGSLSLPTETEILDICKNGEDQIYEFKSAGTEARKITREIAAMLNTKQGGLILYGVDDEGTIQGSDVPRQKLDQPLHNSVKNSISPAAVVSL